jgi:crotonobetainyl-CoA:carnitine CoA-transferase CaiB-like acyl-CoA transferase
LSELAAALTGIRVISFGAFVAGNISAKLLAEMGADVIKIEPRSRPEVLRTPAYAIGAMATEPSGAPNTVMYATLSRGTRNLSMDLGCPAARPVFHRLVARSDIVIENFATDTLSGWGCSFADLLVDNPRLVMLSLSGYGRSGPRAGYLGYASTMSSFLGLSWAWEYAHGTLTDYVTAVTGATAAVAALAQAQRTGQPAHLDVAQIDAMAPLLAGILAAPLNLAQDETAVANRVPGSWLSGVFPSQGYDAWLAVDIENAEDWDVLCRFLERPDLTVSLADKARLLEPELRRTLTGWASRHSAYTGMHVLQKMGLAAAVVQTSEDIWRDPQLQVRGFGERVDQPDLGPVTYPTSAQRWTKTPGSIRVAPHRLGQDTDEILREWIGMADAELAELAAQGAIFDAGRGSGHQ